MYVYKYICMLIYIYLYECIYIYVCAYINIYMYMYMYICITSQYIYFYTHLDYALRVNSNIYTLHICTYTRTFYSMYFVRNEETKFSVLCSGFLSRKLFTMIFFCMATELQFLSCYKNGFN